MGKAKRETFGWRLKRLRMDLGLTQEDLRAELERATGRVVGKTYITDLERTERMPSLAMAAAMARMLGTTTDYLALLSDDPEPPRAQPEQYISPEADEVARLMDAMPADARRDLLAVAQRMAQSTTGPSPRKADVDMLLRLVELDYGIDARRRLERALLGPFDRAPDTGD